MVSICSSLIQMIVRRVNAHHVRGHVQGEPRLYVLDLEGVLLPRHVQAAVRQDNHVGVQLTCRAGRALNSGVCVDVAGGSFMPSAMKTSVNWG
jgi:hypothetical protein